MTQDADMRHHEPVARKSFHNVAHSRMRCCGAKKARHHMGLREFEKIARRNIAARALTRRKMAANVDACARTSEFTLAYTLR